MDSPGQHWHSEKVKTTCPYCGVGCGVTMQSNTNITIDYNGNTTDSLHELSELSGDNRHPANFGRLCVKGSHLLDTTSNDDKLLYPMVDGERTTWELALDKVANKIKQCVEEYGPDSVAFYLSGQLLTEDYYIANKLMKGFIGTANVDTNSRLCMSSAVAAYKRAFGADAVPCCYDDLDQTDLLVLVGSNAAWTHPILFQRMQKNLETNPDAKMIVIDPRKTATAKNADMHLALKPGTDAWVYNGLLRYLIDNDFCDYDYIKAHTNNFELSAKAVEGFTVEKVAQVTELSAELLEQFYSMFAKAESAITFYSMGINQSTSGVDKANAIINVHLATAKIGKPGSAPFSITGQPNAMGGREVGGLANMLAAHMDVENPEHNDLVQRFWSAPNMAKKNGKKAVDMFNDIDTGKIKFIWVMGTNPVVSMPNRLLVERALSKCDMVVVSDIVTHNDTLRYAHVALPATGWSEKDGTVTNSERRISRQKGIVPLQGECKHDWQIISEVASRLGYKDAFAYSQPLDIFDEHARLSAFENNGQRDFDISGLTNLSTQQYNQLNPVQWPINDEYPKGKARLFEDGQYFTPNKKANFVAITPSLPEQLTSSEYPFVLNTGRMRDQWHTMTRTGKANALTEHTAQATIAMHPADALSKNISDGDLVSLCSSVNPSEPLIAPVSVTDDVRKGELFAPIHWSKTNSSHVGLGSLLTSANDPISGQPELKHAAVSVNKVPVDNTVLLAISQDLVPAEIQLSEYQVRINYGDYWLFQLADFEETNAQQDIMVQVLETLAKTSKANQLVWLSKCDLANDLTNKLGFVDGKLCAQLISARGKPSVVPFSLLNPEFTSECFSQMSLSQEYQRYLLNAKTPEEFKQGKLICSCFQVRKLSIENAVIEGCDTVDKLGKSLKCGTNCGSCKSELKSIIDATEIPVLSKKKDSTDSALNDLTVAAYK